MFPVINSAPINKIQTRRILANSAICLLPPFPRQSDNIPRREEGERILNPIPTISPPSNYFSVTNFYPQPAGDLEAASATTSAALGTGQIRYRSPSSAELLDASLTSATSSSSSSASPDHQMTRRQGYRFHDDKIQRYRGVILVISVPLLLIAFVLFVMPSGEDSVDSYAIAHRKVPSNLSSGRSYAVIFDAGSSGSRVHVYCFDRNLDLIPIGMELELFVQIKPGLSAYAANPRQAAESLLTLLDKAEGVVPKELRSSTPVRVGATAGLRALEGDTSDRILDSVRELLKDRSSLRSDPQGVTVLDGMQEGAYQWVTINYLLGNLGKEYPETVGIVDLGGGSVQMAYAISDEAAAKAPSASQGEDAYVNKMYLRGRMYNLYVHSYLHYGLLAARAEILKISGKSGSPCILAGYEGSYKYGGVEFDASSTGSNMNKCRRQALEALQVNESTCTHMKCTFGGVWNGGGGDGQKNLFVASFFFDRAAEAGFIDPNQPVARVSASDFEDAAKRACQTNLQDAKSSYPLVEEANLPYLCMDLVYQYTLLVDGFAVGPRQKITLVKKVKYQNDLVEAAWPLGSAIEAVSS